jgi:hypothetical protein
MTEKEGRKKKKKDSTHHEARLDDPERIGADGAGCAGDHGGEDVDGPRVLAHDGLVALRRGRRVEPF